MKIQMISSEGPPLARPGALMDILQTLPSELAARGHDVCLTLPFHREIQRLCGAKAIDTGVSVEIVIGYKKIRATLLEWRALNGTQCFFVRADEYFDRAEIYAEHGVPYSDNAERFIFFARAAVELARHMDPPPEVLHVHDWAAALVPVFVHQQDLPFGTVLTIHHLEEQGEFPHTAFPLTGLPASYFTPRGVEFFGKVNFLKSGILFADQITTASERFAREIQTPLEGCGLDAVLREQSAKLSGILQGADDKRWNPATDAALPKCFGPENLVGKAACRAALLADCNLAPAPCGPVFGMVTRVVREKGFDVLLPTLDRLLADDVRLIILGEGDPQFETALAIAARKYPTRFAYRKSYDEKLAHLIEAGMDVALIPSRFEPAGLSAMYSLKYGAVPVARATGGIHQIIEDYDPTEDSGWGFLYYDYSSEALWDSIKRARDLYRDQTCWRSLMRRAMTRDFSWSKAAAGYERVYRQALPFVRAA